MCGVLVAEEDNIKSNYIDAIFNTIWQDGLNMNDEIVIQKVLKNLNVNPKTFALRSASSLIKDSLRKKLVRRTKKGSSERQPLLQIIKFLGTRQN